MKLKITLSAFMLLLSAALFSQEWNRNKLNVDFSPDKIHNSKDLISHQLLRENSLLQDEEGWRLDSGNTYSIIYPDSLLLNKMLVQYENNGLKEIETYKDRSDENEDWDNYARITWEYDSDGNITVYKTQFWIDNEWKNTIYNGYAYDVNGNILVSEYLTWNEALDDWWVDQRSEYFYENNLEKRCVKYRQLPEFTELFAYSKYEKAYDGSGRILSKTTFEPDSKAWKETEKEEYTYTPDSTVILKSKFLDAQWQQDEKTVEKNPGLTWYVDRYDYVGKEWLHTYKSTTRYNEDTLLIYHESFNFHEGTGWRGSVKTSLEWYEFFKRQYHFSWNYTSEEWDSTFIREYEFNVFDDGMKYSRYLSFDDGSMTWSPVSSTLYFYTSTTFTDEITGEGNYFIVFPNPARDDVVVKMDLITEKYHLNIYDLNGRLLLNKEIDNKETRIPLKEMPAGTYLLEVSSGDQKMSRKLLLR